MEMIDRYLQAVKFAVPAAQRDDIMKELSDSILSQIEEKEAALGRPLSEDEQVEMLKKLGSPLQVRDGPTLRTLADARAWILKLPAEEQQWSAWQAAARKMLDSAMPRPSKTVAGRVIAR